MPQFIIKRNLVFFYVVMLHSPSCTFLNTHGVCETIQSGFKFIVLRQNRKEFIYDLLLTADSIVLVLLDLSAAFDSPSKHSSIKSLTNPRS